jgi:hypothetical protein
MTTRNVANLEALAALFDTLAAYEDPDAGEGADRYNQGTFGATSECGTRCCLAGWEMVRLYGTDRAFELQRLHPQSTTRTDADPPTASTTTPPKSRTSSGTPHEASA